MKNPRKKGQQMEQLCLSEFKNSMAQMKDYIFVDEWISRPAKYQNQDFFHSFDICIAYDYNPHGVVAGKIQLWYCIQVKSKFSLKLYRQLQAKWRDAPAKCYIACYSKLPRHIKLNEQGSAMEAERVSLKGFELVRI